VPVDVIAQFIMELVQLSLVLFIAFATSHSTGLHELESNAASNISSKYPPPGQVTPENPVWTEIFLSDARVPNVTVSRAGGSLFNGTLYLHLGLWDSIRRKAERCDVLYA
jgi:hypothetical protein